MLGAIKNAAIIFSLVFLFSIQTVHADERTPEESLREVITLIQKKGDPSPIVDYVDWEDNFSKLPDKNKELMDVSSSDDLREFYRRVLLSPTGEIERLFNQKFKGKLDPEKVKPVFEAMKKRTLEKEQEIKDKIKKSKYSVGKASITDNLASVPLSYTFHDQTKTDDVQMIKKGDRWLLTSPSFMKESTSPE